MNFLLYGDVICMETRKMANKQTRSKRLLFLGASFTCCFFVGLRFIPIYSILVGDFIERKGGVCQYLMFTFLVVFFAIEVEAVCERFFFIPMNIFHHVLSEALR